MSKSSRNETRLLPLPPSFFASVRLLSLSVRRSHKEIQPLLLSSQRKQVRPRPRFLRSDSLVLITANGQLGLQETTLPVVPDPTRLRSSSVRPGVQCGGRGRRNWDKIKDMCVMRACPSSLPPSNYPRHPALRSSSVSVSQSVADRPNEATAQGAEQGD